VAGKINKEANHAIMAQRTRHAARLPKSLAADTTLARDDNAEAGFRAEVRGTFGPGRVAKTLLD